MGEDSLLEGLTEIPESACLRTLSIYWPLALLCRPTDDSEKPGVVAAVSEGFLDSLLGELPLGRHLTHLASSHPFAAEQARVIRGFGVEPVHAQHSLWMHHEPPAVFQARKGSSSLARPVSSSS